MLLDGLIGWWDLEEATGTRFDSHGTKDFSESGSYGRATGIQGYAASHDASAGNYLYQNGLHDVGSDDFTLNVWVRGSGAIHGKIIMNGRYNAEAAVGLGFVNSQPRMELSDGVNTIQTSPIGSVPYGSWTMLTIVIDRTAGTATYYANGSSDPRVVDISGWGALSVRDRFDIGRVPGQWAGWFGGELDSLGMWSRALTAAEVDELYNSGAGLSYTDIAGSASEPETITLSYASSSSAGYSIAATASSSGIPLSYHGSESAGYALQVVVRGAAALSHAASTTLGRALAIEAQPTPVTLGFAESATTGQGLAATASPASLTFSYAASATLAYGVVAAPEPAGVILSYGESQSAGYALTAVETGAITLSHAASESVGYAVSAAATPQVLPLAYAATSTQAYDVTAEAQPSQVTLSHAASESIVYELTAVGTGAATLSHTATSTEAYAVIVEAEPTVAALAYRASQTAAYGLSIEGAITAVTMGYADSVTAGYTVAVEAQAAAGTLAYSTSSTDAYGLIALETAAADTITLSHSESDGEAYGLEVLAVPAQLQLAYAEAAAAAYGLSAETQAALRALAYALNESTAFSPLIGEGRMLGYSPSQTQGWDITPAPTPLEASLAYLASQTLPYPLRVHAGTERPPRGVILSLQGSVEMQLALTAVTAVEMDARPTHAANTGLMADHRIETNARPAHDVITGLK